MIGKRGSHVGVMLSFVIFVTLLIFLYSAIQPLTKTKKEKQSLLDFLKVELIKKFSADLTTVTISVDDSITYDDTINCLTVTNEGIFGTNYPLPLFSIVKGEGNIIIPSNHPNNILTIEWNYPNRYKKFFKIYYSDQRFDTSLTSNSICITPIINLVRTNEYIFESKINEIALQGYETFKNELKITPGSEFGFIFSDDDTTTNDILMNDNTPKGIDIYSEQIPIQYIDSHADTKSGFLTIKVW